MMVDEPLVNISKPKSTGKGWFTFGSEAPNNAREVLASFHGRQSQRKTQSQDFEDAAEPAAGSSRNSRGNGCDLKGTPK